MNIAHIKVYLNDATFFGHDEEWAHDLCAKVLYESGFLTRHPGRTYEVNLNIVDDLEIRTLNNHYRDKDKPTNVLSFPAYDPSDIYPAEIPIPLGDIIISHETITREAAEQDKNPDQHFTHMVVHGLLHLVGYDHENEQDAEKMESLEISILEDFGIKNPYIL